MRRLQPTLLATVAVISFASIASAADMPVKAPVYRTPVATVYNWSGCYIGLNAGGGWARTEFTNTVNTTAFGHLDPGEGFTYDNSGFVGGGQIGCNYQVNQWVFGVEGSFDGTSIKGDANNPAILNDDIFTTKINSLATVTGRVGYAWNNVLLYAKGGYAGANVQFSVSDTNSAGGLPCWLWQPEKRAGKAAGRWAADWNTGSRPIGSSASSTTTSIRERRTTKSAATRAATPSTSEPVFKQFSHVSATSLARST